jgi:Ca-activated chloride channel family protein
MTFDYPWALGALALFIPLILSDLFGSSRKRNQKLPAGLRKKLRLSIVCFRVFIVCAVIALAGPRWGTGPSVSEYRRGLDVVFAIDLSRSMDIRDAQTTGDEGQTRLERGLFIARESVKAVPGARFAAVVGRSRGYLAVPLTWDNEAALGFLETLDGSSMTGRGTNLEAMLDAAANAFQSSSPARKVIVLVSDGETLEGSVKNAVNRRVRDGVIITAVATGSDEGRPVPAAGGSSENSTIVSRRESAVLFMASERTGGAYIDANRNDAASILSAHLYSLARESKPQRGRGESKERRTLFIILAIIAYTASKFVPLLSPASIITAVIVLSSCSQGKIILMEANYMNSRGRYDEAIVSYLKALNYEEAAPYAEYGLGLTFYLLDENKPALKRFEDSQKMLQSLPSGEHNELRYRTSYNAGVVLFSEGDFQAAAASFKDALRENPRRIEAKRNLELSLMSIAGETGENGETKREDKARDVLFDYVRDREQQRWKGMEWAPEEKPTGPDY